MLEVFSLDAHASEVIVISKDTYSYRYFSPDSFSTEGRLIETLKNIAKEK